MPCKRLTLNDRYVIYHFVVVGQNLSLTDCFLIKLG